MLRVGIVAGEASGDYLAADLVRALREHLGPLEVEGVGGEELRGAGCKILYPMEKLAVMGLVEVLGSYLGLWRLRRRLVRHFLASRPDIFIGVDAPDFNLGLELKLRRQGIRTVHYVSPSVWAWRRYRMRQITRAVDLMLVLFPFEADLYRACNVPVYFTGHPLAGRTLEERDPAAARRRLGLPAARTLVALMPGSRTAELSRLLEPMLQAAHWCRQRRQDLVFTGNVVSAEAEAAVRACQSRLQLQDLPLRLYRGEAREVLAAADVALVASGTVTLEALLMRTPMVVTYRVNPITYLFLKGLVRVPHAALPNILAGEALVPELLQGDCRAEPLGQAVLAWLEDPERMRQVRQRFRELHTGLLGAPEQSAATAIAARFDLPGAGR